MKLIKTLFFTLLFISTIVFGQETKPNIVIIYVDNLVFGDLSCYGATEVATLNVDKLASEGVRFTDAHCSAATCTPSRYLLLTGRYTFRKNAVVGKWYLGLGDGNVDWNGKVCSDPLEIGFDYSYLISPTGDRVPSVLLENHHVLNLDQKDHHLMEKRSTS